jgi:hypothetical protein
MLDNTICVELGVEGSFGDQSSQADVVEVGGIRPGIPRDAAPFDLDEMTHERRRCNCFVEANDDLAGTLLATSYAGGFSMTIKREQNRLAFARIVKPENE